MLRHVLYVLFFTTGHGARILGLFPLPGNSHYNLGHALMRELANKGHDVTMVNAFGDKDPPKNGSYRDILVEMFGNPNEAEQRKQHNMFTRQGSSVFKDVFTLGRLSVKSANLIKLDEIQKLLNSDQEHFDVVIADSFLIYSFHAFAAHFKAPLILLSPVYSHFLVNSLVGNPSPPAYIPNVLASYTYPMTFCQRLTNSLVHVFAELLNNLYIFPTHAKIAQAFIPSHPNLYDTLYNVSLVLVNSHSTLNPPMPQVPNMIEIGGFHLQPPKKLPSDLQDFFDSAEHGVIYFSMGSNLLGVQFPEQKRKHFMTAFSKLKQKVLWKWEDDDLPGKPDNVKLIKWAPQQDILAHPNLKLFITHGGFVSSTETAYHGVPVLVIPIFGDQSINAKFAKSTGYGSYIKFEDLSEESIIDSITDIITNPSYKKAAMKRAKVFHDRQVNPMDTATYWVEYVIRHKGAPHLRVAGVDLPWYNYYLVDVILFLLTIVLFCLFALYFILKQVCKNRVKNIPKSNKKVKAKKH